MCTKCQGFLVDVWNVDAGWEVKCVNCGKYQPVLQPTQPEKCRKELREGVLTI